MRERASERARVIERERKLGMTEGEGKGRAFSLYPLPLSCLQRARVIERERKLVSQKVEVRRQKPTEDEKGSENVREQELVFVT